MLEFLKVPCEVLVLDEGRPSVPFFYNDRRDVHVITASSHLVVDGLVVLFRFFGRHLFVETISCSSLRELLR